ncbi:MAG: oleate hydratase [Rhodobacteraceae bacterium]|nr:oleate hydratase [Paracoccaceae bacterium]
MFWGYGLRGDRSGDAIAKPMAEATGGEILAELAHQLRLTADQRAEFFDNAQVVPCRMPFITSQFMPRHPATGRPSYRAARRISPSSASSARSRATACSRWNTRFAPPGRRYTTSPDGWRRHLQSCAATVTRARC